MIDEPDVDFSRWREWRYRDRLFDEYTVPPDFGLLGVYLFAAFEPSEQPTLNPMGAHLDEHVVYIGMSTHVTRRNDKFHNAIRRFKDDLHKTPTAVLWYTDWESPWSNGELSRVGGEAKRAYILYIERKLIWEFTKAFNRLPKLNRM